MKFFKKISLPLMFLLVFAACKSKNDANSRNIQLLPDSSAYNNNSATDSVKMREKSTADAPSGYRYHPKESKTEPVVSGKAPASSGSGTSDNTTTTTQTTRKKGWSKAAQGAVIGGAAGAVGGAIISKHKGTGAAIGAAVGAAGGYIIGRNKDKKDGR